jgi:formylglycine-generating enzyme required for sulfatase activity
MSGISIPPQVIQQVPEKVAKSAAVANNVGIAPPLVSPPQTLGPDILGEESSASNQLAYDSSITERGELVDSHSSSLEDNVVSIPPSLESKHNGDKDRSLSPRGDRMEGTVKGATASPSRFFYILGGVSLAIILSLVIYLFVLENLFNLGEEGSSTSDDKQGWLERMHMVPIGGGNFKLGRDAKPDDTYLVDTPARDVQVNPFMLAKYEVTNQQYQEFIKSTRYRPPAGWSGSDYPANEAELPVTNVTWEDAVAYTQWLSKESGLQFRLPTEEEWEFAARGMDGRLYPWGLEWDAQRTVSGHITNAKPVAVTSAALSNDRSPMTIIGMAGNVSEWTSSPFAFYPGSTAKAAKNDNCADCKIIRGGNYATATKENLMSTHRVWQKNRFEGMERVGFRVAADPPAKK